MGIFVLNSYVMDRKTLLWLDDIRDPKDTEIDWMVFSPIGRDCKVVWVASYEEFTKWITKNGLPDGIAFDHDLGEDIAKAKVAKGMSKRQARKEKKSTKTGYDCAKWLLNYCMDNKKPLPLFSSQSANPTGRENILKLLTNYMKHEEA